MPLCHPAVFLSGLFALAACGNGGGAGSTTSSTVFRTSASSGAVAGSSSGSGGAGSTATGGTGTAGSSGRGTGGSASAGNASSGSGGLGCGATCSGPTPECSPVTGQCVQCLSSQTCSAPEPVCDTSISNILLYGTCQECLQTSDCDGGVCNLTTLACQPDCRASGSASGGSCSNGGHCDPASGACVQCTDFTQCPSGELCTQGSCARCDTSANDCQPDGGLPYCNLEGQCVQCKTNADCDGGTCDFPNPGNCH